MKSYDSVSEKIMKNKNNDFSFSKGDTYHTKKGETFKIDGIKDGVVSISRVGNMGQANGTIPVSRLSKLVEEGTFFKK